MSMHKRWARMVEVNIADFVNLNVVLWREGLL